MIRFNCKTATISKLSILYVSVTFFILLVDDAAVTAPNFSQFKECNYAPSDQSLPKFDVEHELGFELKVKANANDAESISLFEGIGYYDANGARGSTLFRRIYGNSDSGQQQYAQYIYDVEKAHGFLITSQKPRECVTTANFDDSVCTPYVYFIGEESGYEKIAEKCGFIAQPVALDANFTGTARQTAATKWVQCVWLPPAKTGTYDRDGSFWFFEFYHTKPQPASVQWRKSDALYNYTMATVRVAPISLHIRRLDAAVDSARSYGNSVLSGGSRHYVDQHYEFFHYKPYVQHKQAVFEPPAGVSCPDWYEAHYEQKKLPDFKPQFTLSAVTVTSSSAVDNVVEDETSETTKPSTLLHSVISYDAKKHLRHIIIDMKSSSPSETAKQTDSATLHSVIDVFDSGLTFVMRQDQCVQVRPLTDYRATTREGAPPRKEDGDVDSLALLPFLFTRTNNTLENNQRPKHIYIGQRQLNGAQADVWMASSVTSDNQTLINMELYYYPLSTISTTISTPAAIKIYRYNLTNRLPQAGNHRRFDEITTSTISFYSDDPLYWSSFAIEHCLRDTKIVKNDRAQLLVLTVRTDLDSVIKGQFEHGMELVDALKEMIARRAHISPLRVSELVMETVVLPLTTTTTLTSSATVDHLASTGSEPPPHVVQQQKKNKRSLDDEYDEDEDYEHIYVHVNTFRIWFQIYGWPHDVAAAAGAKKNNKTVPTVQEAVAKFNQSLQLQGSGGGSDSALTSLIFSNYHLLLMIDKFQLAQDIGSDSEVAELYRERIKHSSVIVAAADNSNNKQAGSTTAFLVQPENGKMLLNVGYGLGTVISLAFGMLLLGTLGGVLAAFVIWKKKAGAVNYGFIRMT